MPKVITVQIAISVSLETHLVWSFNTLLVPWNAACLWDTVEHD